ncbi:DUF481 domain-containing protein [Ohtaekwangia sp.]|uniref:DUF481 domain-containing protein n=1 Tax=Ohtaekwangia sp. TaxID=2066019 RepID=UPI002FDEB350
MKCLYPYLIFLINCCSVTAFGQFSDTTHYYINGASTGTINKVNEGTSYVLTNNLRFSVSKKDYSYNATSSWTYGKQLSILSNNDVYTGLDFNWYKTIPHFYYWGLANFEKSYSLKINHRYQTGAGIGYNILDRKKALIVLSDGLLYDKGDLYDLPEGGSNQYEVARNSFRIKFRFIIREFIVLEGSHFLQNSLDDWQDYIIKSNTSLSIKLKKGISVTTALSYNKLSATSRENLLFTYGITYERYF